MLYRGYIIEHNPKPIPDSEHDWDYYPEDYDGPEDGRGGTTFSQAQAMRAVDEEVHDPEKYPTIGRFGVVDWAQDHHVFPKITASPHGHQQPFFVEQVSYEHEGYTRFITHPYDLEMPDGEVVQNQEFLIVGPNGIDWYRTIDDFCTYGKPTESHPWPPGYEHPDRLKYGWKVNYARCDQTGGMCMVDVFVFENGVCLTLNDECAVVQEDIRSWDYSGEGYPWAREAPLADVAMVLNAEDLK